MVVKTKLADISLVSRVRTTAGTRRNNTYKHSKNSKKTTRRTTSAIWRILEELDKPKRTLSNMNLTSIDAGKHVLAAVFKLGITRMNNRAISEFDFRRI